MLQAAALTPIIQSNLQKYIETISQAIEKNLLTALTLPYRISYPIDTDEKALIYVAQQYSTVGGFNVELLKDTLNKRYVFSFNIGTPFANPVTTGILFTS